MSVRNVTNYAVSVFSRLKNLSRVKGLPFQRLLMRYAIERFLYRLGCSPVTGNFVLKGGNLFIVWQQGDTYPAVTSIAEKVENMLIREMDNSRMKDFYDVWLLSILFSYDFCELQRAIQNILRRRGTVIPVKIPVTFTDTFGNNTIKQIQWKAFLRKSNLGDAPKDLQVVIDRLASFILPVFQQDMRKTIWNPLLGCWEEKHD